MNCQNCGHSEADHGPESGRWRDAVTGEFTVIIPGRLCYYEENIGHCEDLCACQGFTTVFDIFAHRGMPCWMTTWPAYYQECLNYTAGTAE